MGLDSRIGWRQIVAVTCSIVLPWRRTHAWVACPEGRVKVDGLGRDLTLVNGGEVDESGTEIRLNPGEYRSYFSAGEANCTNTSSPNEDLLGINPLGCRVSFTVDVSAAGCNCNVALYLVSMKQNNKTSSWAECHGDPGYCDANNICGASCEEVDLMEANRHVFLSTLHGRHDGVGAFGGYSAYAHDFNPLTASPDNGSDYYPHGEGCIDSARPFNVRLDFPVDAATGGLDAALGMGVDLQQASGVGACRLEWRSGVGYAEIPRISKAMQEGMVLTASYWGGNGHWLNWFDGAGWFWNDTRQAMQQGGGACPDADRGFEASDCEGQGVIRNLKVDCNNTDAPSPVPTATPRPSGVPRPPPSEVPTPPPTPHPSSPFPSSAPSPPPTPMPVKKKKAPPDEGLSTAAAAVWGLAFALLLLGTSWCACACAVQARSKSKAQTACEAQLDAAGCGRCLAAAAKEPMPGRFWKWVHGGGGGGRRGGGGGGGGVGPTSLPKLRTGPLSEQSGETTESPMHETRRKAANKTQRSSWDVSRKKPPQAERV